MKKRIALSICIFLVSFLVGCSRVEEAPLGLHAVISEESTPTPAVATPIDTNEATLVEYSYEGVSMGIALPEGWSYETMAAEPQAERFGIKFWPDSEPSVELNLEYYVNSIGLCGTGVTFTKHEFANGLTATAATEIIQGEQWFMLIYDEPHVNFAVSCAVDLNLWESYEANVMAILDTISLEGQLKPQ